MEIVIHLSIRKPLAMNKIKKKITVEGLRINWDLGGFVKCE